MPALQIVVDKREDFRWADPGDRVVSAETYLAAPKSEARTRVINLCREYSYLSAGYYVSLLADARGDRAVPDVRAFSEMEQREFRAEHAAVLDQLLRQVPKMPRSVHSFSVHAYFGDAQDRF